MSFPSRQPELLSNEHISAASAIAANTFLRSLCAAVFPLFATYMFDAIGVNWAGTLLGCVAVVMIPIPIFFYTHGRKIRAKSKYAPIMKPMGLSEGDGSEEGFGEATSEGAREKKAESQV